MNVRYLVELSQAERGELITMLSGGKHAARKLKRAQILLAADAGCGDDEIARTVEVGGFPALGYDDPHPRSKKLRTLPPPCVTITEEAR
jgi:hypothetical protein